MFKVFFIFLFLFSILETNVSAKIIKLEKCFKIEQLILRKYAKYRWIDNDILEPLDGRTEFLKVDQNKIKEMQKLIGGLLYEPIYRTFEKRYLHQL